MKTVRNDYRGNKPNDKPLIYREQLLTVEDLEDFKRQLVMEITNLLKAQGGQPARRWLKSHDVRKLLNISAGTLQTLRVNGTLAYTRMGGIIFYDVQDIERMLESQKLPHRVA